MKNVLKCRKRKTDFESNNVASLQSNVPYIPNVRTLVFSAIEKWFFAFRIFFPSEIKRCSEILGKTQLFCHSAYRLCIYGCTYRPIRRLFFRFETLFRYARRTSKPSATRTEHLVTLFFRLHTVTHSPRHDETNYKVRDSPPGTKYRRSEKKNT